MILSMDRDTLLAPAQFRAHIIRSWPFHAYLSITAMTGISTLLLSRPFLLVVNALCVIAMAIITAIWLIVLQRGNECQEQTAHHLATQLQQEGHLQHLHGYQGEIAAAPARFRRKTASCVGAIVLFLVAGRIWPDLWIRASSFALTFAYLGAALGASEAETARADTILSLAALEGSQEGHSATT